MSGINTGILQKAYPLSAERIKELETRVLNDNKAFAYLDENGELCFAMPHGVDGIKELAWNNAYELQKENDIFIKKVYKKTGLDAYALRDTLQKQSLESDWPSSNNGENSNVIIYDGNADGRDSFIIDGGNNREICVKISSNLYTIDELSTATYTFKRTSIMNGDEEFVGICDNEKLHIAQPHPDLVVVGTDICSIIVCYKSGEFDMFGIVVHSPGVYVFAQHISDQFHDRNTTTTYAEIRFPS